MQQRDYADCWVCEGCGNVYEGVNPPDECPMCLHAFFENMSDLLKSRIGKECDA